MSIPRRERAEVQAELVGIWGQATKSEALTHLAAFQARYAVRYPEAVRSLMEDEEHLLTFYAFPQTMQRHIQSTNAICACSGLFSAQLEIFLLSWQHFWRARFLCFMQNGATIRHRCADQSDRSEKFHHASDGPSFSQCFHQELFLL